MIYLLCALLGGGVLTAICVPLFRKEHTLESAIIEETEWDLLAAQEGSSSRQHSGPRFRIQVRKAFRHGLRSRFARK